MKLSDTGVDTLGQHGGNDYDDAGDWTPHPILLKNNINIMNVPGDGNCLLHACTSKLQNLLNICDFTTQQAINMRNVLMDHLISHASDQTASGMTLSELAMLRASEIESELKKKTSSRDAIVSTLDDYAHYMRFADPDRCLYTDTPELYLISICYTLNIAVYQVDPCSSHHYALIQTFYGDKNNTERVVYLFLHGLHYQRIFTVDGSYSYIADGGDGDDEGEESISIIDNNYSSDENNTSHVVESNEPTVVVALLQNHWLKNKPPEFCDQYEWRKAYERALAEASVWINLNVSRKNRLLERWKENLCIPNHLLENWRDVLCVPEQFEAAVESENENEMLEPLQCNEDAFFIDSTRDDSIRRTTSHQSRSDKLKHPPPNWKQSSVFQKIFKCDYDGFKISGKVDIISAIPGKLSQVTISSQPGRSKQKTGHMLLVASSPYYIYVNEEFKPEIIAEIDQIRRIPHRPSLNKHALLYKNITMETPQFVKLLRDAGVDTVTIVGYGQKATLAWGRNLMQTARGVDRNCFCEFDMAAEVPPEIMHWARYSDHHMAPVDFDDNGINKLNLLTLVAITRNDFIQSKFGKNSIVEHWPQYVTAQLELYGFECPPIYGSLNIQARGKAYLHRSTSILEASDDFEVDDNESTNYDEDYDGTHSESN
jgi:hypothetical protein